MITVDFFIQQIADFHFFPCLQYKEKLAALELQLEEEKKKSEDLQFIVDEHESSVEESEVEP